MPGLNRYWIPVKTLNLIEIDIETESKIEKNQHWLSKQKLKSEKINTYILNQKRNRKKTNTDI